LAGGEGHVGGADVAGADLAYVLPAGGAGDQQAEGNRAGQICDQEPDHARTARKTQFAASAAIATQRSGGENRSCGSYGNPKSRSKVKSRWTAHRNAHRAPSGLAGRDAPNWPGPGA